MLLTIHNKGYIMDFPRMSSTVSDPASDNLRKLSTLFPSIIKDGQVDFDALKVELGQFEEVGKERYELTWAGKQEAMKNAVGGIEGKTLKYIPEESKNPDATENLYIEGDNLEVLKILQNSYMGKIKMIYIDPPYNIGGDYIYNDNFRQTSGEAAKEEGDISESGERYTINTKSSGKYHSRWLSMMYPRLRLAKNLLLNEGVIFISIGDDELSNLKSISDEIFGSSNYVGTVSRLMKSGGNKGRFFSPNIDYILVYAKNINAIGDFKGELDPLLIEKLYTKVDVDGPRKGERYRPFGLYQSSLDARANQRYYIECPDGSLAIPPGKTLPREQKDGSKVIPEKTDGCWRWSDTTYFNERNNLVFIESSKGVLITPDGTPSKWNVYTKIYLQDRLKEGQTPANFTSKYENRQSAKEIKKLGIPFDFAKPSNLITYLTSLIDNTRDSIILDFFSGSATTAHAVMQLNAEDSGNRKFIMIQYPEECPERSEAAKTGYKTISDIGKERIRRAGEKIAKEHPEAKIDTGFKVFKVDNTNIRWIAAENRIGDTTLADAITTTGKDLRDFLPNTKDADIVYEILIRQYDIPLSVKIEKLSAIGPRTYSIADALIVCLEENVTPGIIDTVAAIEPVPHKIIFRDSAFDDDIALKENTMMRLDALMQKHARYGKQPYRVEFL